MGTEKEGFLRLIICQLRSGFSERRILKGIRGKRIGQDTNHPPLASTCRQGYNPPCTHIPHTYINIQTSIHTVIHIQTSVCICACAHTHPVCMKGKPSPEWFLLAWCLLLGATVFVWLCLQSGLTQAACNLQVEQHCFSFKKAKHQELWKAHRGLNVSLKICKRGGHLGGDSSLLEL